MDKVITLLGVGGGTGAFLLILAFVVRGAIAAAVKQAGAEEMARLQAKLNEELESKRQQFQTELEEVRARASLSLEEFKSELQLASEVRRQVAARKVDALVRIAVAGEALQRDVLNVRPNVPTDRANMMVRVHEYMKLVRENAFLFDRVVAGQFHQYAADLIRAEVELNTKYDASAIERAQGAVNGFLDLARKELGVTTV